MVEVIGFLAGLFAVVGGLYKAFSWFRARTNKSTENTGEKSEGFIASRFIQLFESHGVHRNQIPEFFGHELTLADVQTEERLIEKLSPSTLSEAAKLFQINSEWLSHGKGEIFPQHHFYKHPGDFGRFIDELRADNTEKDIEGYVLTVRPPYSHENDTLILLKEEIGSLGNRTIHRYHFCTGWIFSYWKCCADIACCIAQAQMRNLYLVGKYVDAGWITSVSDGMRLPEYDFEIGEIDFPRTGYWSADQFVDMPEDFIKPLNRNDGYSVESAINRWLEYHEKGLLYAFSDDVNEGARRLFEQFRDQFK